MNRELFSNILDSHNIERSRCRVCGKDIFYHDTTIHTKRSGEIEIKGKSYKSSKKVLNKLYYLSVCEDCLCSKYRPKNLSRTFNVMSDITKFAYNIPDEVFTEYRKHNYGSSLEHKIRKFGKDRGHELWKKYCKRQAETNSLEYKSRVYDMSPEEFREYNKSRAVTLKNLIKKYGEVDGKNRYNAYVEKQKITKSWDYMVEKYGINRARQINQSKVLSRDNFIRKYGEIEGENKWIEYINSNKGYSKISQELFRKIDSYLSQHYTTYFATKNFEYVIKGEGDNHYIYLLDYYIEELKICIEFNGSCFHGDPRLYEDDAICNPKSNLTAKELRDKDELRYRNLKMNHNITTYVIWELDYNEDFNVESYIKNVLNINIE